MTKIEQVQAPSFTPLPNRRNTYVAYLGGLPPEEQDEQIGFIVHALEQFGKL